MDRRSAESHSQMTKIFRRNQFLLVSTLVVSLFLCIVYLYHKTRLQHTHAYITSAYYYKNSQSLGANALAMVVVMSEKTYYNLEKYKMTIVGSNGTHSLKSEASLKVEKIENMACEYVMVLVQAQTIHNPTTLEIESFGNRVEIPFREPRRSSPSSVVICISPQFVAEKWQLFLMNIHVVRRYGGHMHVYITSMIEELFDTLKVYEKWGNVTLDYWVRMKFENAVSPYADPMSNVEWSNQAGAQTDCLLQYKEVADFVAFFDIDDILIPRQYDTYHEEFSSHFRAFPSYHSVFYNKRDVAVQRIDNATNFSFRLLFSSMELLDGGGYGKCVVRTLKYNSTWIHHSLQLERNRMITAKNLELTHVKDILRMELDLNESFEVPKIYGTNENYIEADDIKKLDMDFQKAFEDEYYQEAALKMIDHNFYGPIIVQCTNELLYRHFSVEKKGVEEMCPNADHCLLPQREDIKCIHSDAYYMSGPEMHTVTFHYAIRPFWSRDIGCYQ